MQSKIFFEKNQILNAGEGKRKKERENCEASFWLR
jgi:hypothetical protein